MFKEQSIDEFMYNMEDERMDFDELTEEELKLQLQSYKMMQILAEQGKTIYTFDQEWLM